MTNSNEDPYLKGILNREAPDPRLAPGHNNPPSPTEIIKSELEEKHKADFAKVLDIAARANDLPKSIINASQADKITDMIVEARSHKRKLDEARKVEKKPFLDGGDAVDVTFKVDRWSRLDNIEKVLGDRLTTWNVAEARRIREEEAAERARLQKIEDEKREAARLEAEMLAEANQPAPEPVQEPEPPIETKTTTIQEATRRTTSGGAGISTRVTVRARVLNYAEVDLIELRPFMKPEHIDAALAKFVDVHKKTRPVKGVEFYDDEKAVVRGR